MQPIRSKDRFLVFGAPAIEEEEIAEVVATLRSGWLGTGPRVHRFEEDFRSYKEADHAVAVNSCTAALHLSMLAAGVGPGDEVITPALTFASTVNAILHAGATPVLADIDRRTMNIDVEDVERRVGPRTRALLPVHFAGRPCQMDALIAIARKHDLRIIEDCAHAIESEYRGRKAGTMGDFGCFSFYVTKNVVTGEGGMVLTADAELASRVKMLALHGLSKDAWKRFSDEGYQHYFVTDLGFKYNMTDLQAAIGVHQLGRVERNWERRRRVWELYDRALADLPVVRPAESGDDIRHALHLYTILIDDQRTGVSRDEFLRRMTANNIGVGVHYLSIPEHPYYQQRFGWRPQDWPVAMDVGRRTVSLPLSARLVDEDVDDVVHSVARALDL